MRHVRAFLIVAILAICLFVAINPVFAAAGGNGNGNNGNGKGNGGDPGGAALPEAPFAVLLPIVGLAVVGLTLFIIYRRRQHTHDMAAE